MNILAIDPGTRLGWCRSELEAGTEDFSPKRHEGAGMRYVRFRHWLSEVLANRNGVDAIDMVAYEEVHRHLGTEAAHVYGALVAMIQEHCERCQVPYKGIPVGTIKKYATGKGNANKDLMMAAAAKRWTSFKGDDNQADAMFIWAYAQETYA